MRQIRRNVFETNSSSTHSISITTKKMFDDWKQGKVKYNKWADTWLQAAELTEDDIINCIDEYMRNKPSYYKNWNDLDEKDKQRELDAYASKHLKTSDDGYTYSEYMNSISGGCEYSCVSYTTEHGDEIIAFGYGGYDG